MEKDNCFDSMKRSIDKAESLKEIKATPLVKTTITSILKSVPVIGDLLDGCIDAVLTEFQQRKRNELIQLILSDGECITSAMVNDVEFIINFAKTLEAVNRLATNDKVCYFANLLRNGYLGMKRISNDEFEEYIYLLSTLSYREIEHLVVLYRFEKRQRQSEVHTEHENVLKEFNAELDKAFHDSTCDSYDVYQRLCGTGLVQQLYKTNNPTVEKHEVSSEYYDGIEYEVSNIEIENDGFFSSTTAEQFIEYIMDNEKTICMEDTPNGQA